MTRYLVIKGDKFDAARAAAERGIPLAFVRELRDCGVQTIGQSSCDPEKLYAWLAEGPSMPPFPNGSLLHWSTDFKLASEAASEES